MSSDHFNKLGGILLFISLK